jgi:hypothetical protein
MHSTLTLRQLVRVCKKAAHQPHLLPQILRDSVLAQFLPPEIRDAVDRWLNKGKVAKSGKTNLETFLQKKEEDLRAGLRARNVDMHLVPNILFHDNPRHSEILQGAFLLLFYVQFLFAKKKNVYVHSSNFLNRYAS